MASRSIIRGIFILASSAIAMLYGRVSRAGIRARIDRTLHTTLKRPAYLKARHATRFKATTNFSTKSRPTKSASGPTVAVT